MRRLAIPILLAVASLACGLQPSAGHWTGTAAIALATSWGSPVGFTCVMAWDLRLEDARRPSDLHVIVRFPSAVQELLTTLGPSGRPRTEPWPRYDQWQEWTNSVATGSSTLAAMGERKHFVGTAGVPCATEQATDAMRGSELRIDWTDRGARHSQVITAREVRQWVRMTVDGSDQLQLEWRASAGER